MSNYTNFGIFALKELDTLITFYLTMKTQSLRDKPFKHFRKTNFDHNDFSDNVGF